MSDYNDAQCNIHSIVWSSTERGTTCPACEAENKLDKAVKLLIVCERFIFDSWSDTKEADALRAKIRHMTKLSAL